MIRTIPPHPNGKLPASRLKAIPGGKLWTPAANAWLDLIDFTARHEGKAAASALKPGGLDSSYRGYDRQSYWKQYWIGQGQPWKAAEPGTSNHGLGIAVDCPSPTGKAMLRKHGARFGWSNYEGQRVDEDWHWVYCGPADYERMTIERPLVFSQDERYHIDRLRAARRTKNRHGGWNKVASLHQKQADVSKEWLRKQANALESNAAKDREYLARKVRYLRDVAFDRKGLGT